MLNIRNIDYNILNAQNIEVSINSLFGFQSRVLLLTPQTKTNNITMKVTYDILFHDVYADFFR